jgi:hypothetical protein
MVRSVPLALAMMAVGWVAAASCTPRRNGHQQSKSQMKDPRERIVQCPELAPDRDHLEIGLGALAYCNGRLDGVFLTWEARVSERPLLYVPLEERWRREGPPWARDQRDKILARILEMANERRFRFVVVESP